MKNIDKYDEEVKNIDTEEVARFKAKIAERKALLLFSAKLFIYHLAACVLYIIMFSPATGAEVAHDTNGEAGILSFFCVIAISLFSLFISFELSSKGELRRDFTDLLKIEPMTLKLLWSLSRKPIIRYGIIYFVIQLPFAVFHHFFGFEYVYPTVIDNFYTIDAGLMELTGIGIVGAILNTLLFTVLHALFRFMTYRRWKSEIL